MMPSARIKYIITVLVILSSSVLIAGDENIDNAMFDGYITGDDVRVRESYSTDSKIIGFLKIGTPIKCTSVTKYKYPVGNDIEYWYKCTPKAFGVNGWVYGKFVSKQIFDYNRHIASLPDIKYNSKMFDSLINTKWSTCDGNLPIECYATYFKKKTVETYGMEGNFTYQIVSIEETGNHLIIIGKMIMSNISLDTNTDQSLKLIIQIINNKTIKINNGIVYKL